MRILVVGGGGREHALCWAIAGSPLCDKLYCAPGNAGIQQDAECVPISAEDVIGLTVAEIRSCEDGVIAVARAGNATAAKTGDVRVEVAVSVKTLTIVAVIDATSKHICRVVCECAVFHGKVGVVVQS